MDADLEEYLKYANGCTDGAGRIIESLVEEVRRFREAAKGVLAVDVKYEWRILTPRAAERFAALQRALGGVTPPPGRAG
jgi:hypothetical protein